MKTKPFVNPKTEVKTLDKSRIPELYAFYQPFFPAEELFDWEVFRNAAKHSIEWVVEDDAQHLIGALDAYEKEKFIYGMFLAVDPQMRKKGIADSLMRTLLAYTDQTGKLLVGEIEPVDPEVPFTGIRAEMYQRMGFKLNPQAYQAPNCAIAGQNVPYCLISYPRLLSEDEFRSFVGQIRQIYINESAAQDQESSGGH